MSSKSDDILQRVTTVVSNLLDVPADRIFAETIFAVDLHIDSIDAAELAMELEHEFDISIQDDDVERLLTVADVVKFIENYKPT